MSVETAAAQRRAGSRKLSARYAGLLMPLLLSVFMTFIVSAIATLRNVGVPPNFLSLWLSAWGLSWVVAFPTLLVVLPLVRRLVAAMVEGPQA